jgi:ribonuclease HI
VKGHADNEENERCDELARDAINEEELETDDGAGGAYEHSDP